MMNDSELQSLMHATIYAALRRTFSHYVIPVGWEHIAEEFWSKLALCIAESAKDIVAEVRKADVLPGIAVATTGVCVGICTCVPPATCTGTTKAAGATIANGVIR